MHKIMTQPYELLARTLRKVALFKAVVQGTGKAMTIVRPFNPTSIPSKRDVDSSMIIEISFNPI
jgi:hypothetical protein